MFHEDEKWTVTDISHDIHINRLAWERRSSEQPNAIFFISRNEQNVATFDSYFNKIHGLTKLNHPMEIYDPLIMCNGAW
jgi:hypothetical protein